MKKLLVTLSVLGSFSAFANPLLEEVHMKICQREVDVSTYRNTDISSEEYVVIKRGVACSRIQQQCQQQQYPGQRSFLKNKISIDNVSYIREGEAKIYKNKLYICNK
ncbi:MAG: hypothetical protein KC478_16320 [Bacteriovoracaceae bacterium]|nr:hypothetical protein [Bacteriovoracaceae bacterium]